LLSRALVSVAGCATLLCLAALPVRSIVNGDFESGTEGWDWTVDSHDLIAGARTGGEGSFFANVQNLTSVDGFIFQTESEVQPGETWRVEGWIRVHSGGFEFGWFSSDFPWDSGPNNVTSVESGWQYVSVTQTFESIYDPGYRDVRLDLFEPGASVDVDDIRTTLVTGVQDWCLY